LPPILFFVPLFPNFFPVMYERILFIFCRLKLNYFSCITKTFIPT
jgi:hypothetical protein